MTLLDMFFWFILIWIISLICGEAYRRSTRFVRGLLNIFSFIGVFIHEIGHALMCFLFRVPIVSFSVRLHYRSEISPHGHVRLKDSSRISFLQGIMITLGPLFLSTWVFLLCLDLIWVQGVDAIAELTLVGIMVSVAIGASPSRPDLNMLIKSYRNDPSNSIYQLVLLFLSFIIVNFLINFSVILDLPMELLSYIIAFFTILIVYYMLRYSIKAIGYLMTKIFHLSIVHMKGLTRKRHRPSRRRAYKYEYHYEKELKEVTRE
ncbi:MAG: hypothetical protein ACFFBH_10740 [Promethearchaeota archaeon]